MPAIAIVAAVALDAGVAVGAITSTLGIVAAVGATVSAIGAITGNKDLSLAGGALGLVGGIGALASNAGLFSAATDLFGSAADETGAAVSDAFDTATDTAIQGAESTAASGANLPATAATDVVDATGGVSAIDPAGAINSTSIAPTEGNAAAIETSGDPNSVLAKSISPDNVAPPASSTGAPSGSASGSGTAAASGTGSGSFVDPATGQISQTSAPSLGPTWGGGTVPASMTTAPALDAATNGPPGMLNSLMQWGKNNPLLSYGIVQAGGSFLSGLTNPMTPAQINALNAQADANRAAAALANREAANMGQPVPNLSIAPSPKSPVSSSTVTGAPAGLINTNNFRSNLVATPQVTGAPAPLTPGGP